MHEKGVGRYVVLFRMLHTWKGPYFFAEDQNNSARIYAEI